MMNPPTYQESYRTRRIERDVDLDSQRHSRAARHAAREAAATVNASEPTYGQQLLRIFARAPQLVRFGYLTDARRNT
jgi:hypothetical protein